MSHLYCFVFNQDPGRILRSFVRGPIGMWHGRRMSQNRKPVRQGQNGQRVNDIICPLDNPIEVIRLLNFWISSTRGASILFGCCRDAKPECALLEGEAHDV